MTRRSVALSLVALSGLAALGIMGYGARRALGDADAASTAHARELRDRAHQIAVWERAAASDTTSALALAQLAGLYLQRAREMGDYDDVLRSETVARRSLAIRTNRNARTFSTLVASLVAQHRFAEALPIAEQMVALDPETPSYRAALGEIQMELGRYADAARSFDAVRGATEAPAIAARLARWLEVNGRDDEARRLLNETLLRLMERVDVPAEQIAWFFLRLGEHDLRFGRTRDARAALARGLERAPGDYRLLAAMTRLEASRKRWDAAIDYGERSIAVVLEPAVFGLLADAHAARGDAAQAADARRALEVSVLAQSGTLHRSESLYLLDQGVHVDHVAREVERELASRRDIYAFDLLAWTRYRQGRVDEAAAASRQALSRGTRDALLHYHAGVIAAARGQAAESRHLLGRALEINPRFHFAHADTARAMLARLEGEQASR